jgi:excisionase family DNA binding protein
MPTPPLSVAIAAEQTGVPKRTIQSAITRGELGAHKMPGLTGAYLIRQRDLDKWIAKRAKAGAQ